MARWRIPPENWCGYSLARPRGFGMPTSPSSSTARALAAERDIDSWTRITSAIWLPTLKTGFSAVSGSWKIIETSLPRSARSRASDGRQQILAAEHDPPGREPRRGRRHQAHDRHGRDRLARAGFADDAERLSRADVPAHPVDRPHHTVVGVEVHAQILDRQQRLGVGARTGASRPLRQIGSRSGGGLAGAPRRVARSSPPT